MRLAMSSRDYNAAISCLNKLQTNFAVIEEMNKSGKPLRDEDLVPEMLEWTRRIGYKPEDFDRMNVLHITGTKGKGSTSAFVQSILLKYQQAGQIKNVGLYTSPHLKSVRERIMINGKPLSKEKFAEYFFQVYDRLDSTSSPADRFPRMGDGVKPNYFRYLTLVSFHAFVSENVDAAVYEVGIGGEYDSTNVFVHPVATAVTSLGIDHVNVLGDTIEKIAWNKAGIFKRNTPAYTIDDQPASALRVLEDRAEEKHCKLNVVGILPQLGNISLGLQGDFQRKNATIATYLAAERVKQEINRETPLPPKFVEGLESASWPGRCQVLKTEHNTWYIDGAHTHESLAEAAKWFASARDPQKPVALLFNQQKRDEVAKLLQTLYGALTSLGVRVQAAYFSTNQSWEAGFQADMISHNVSREQVDKLVIQKQLAQVWHESDQATNVQVCSSLEEVVRKVPQGAEVLVTGSLLMVGGLLAVLEPEE